MVFSFNLPFNSIDFSNSDDDDSCDDDDDDCDDDDVKKLPFISLFNSNIFSFNNMTFSLDFCISDMDDCTILSTGFGSMNFSVPDMGPLGGTILSPLL